MSNSKSSTSTSPSQCLGQVCHVASVSAVSNVSAKAILIMAIMILLMKPLEASSKDAAVKQRLFLTLFKTLLRDDEFLSLSTNQQSNVLAIIYGFVLNGKITRGTLSLN